MRFFVAASLWIILCIILSCLGRRHKIGATKAFFISFFFSPFIGFVKVMASEKKEYFTIIKNNDTKYRVIFDKIEIKELYIRRNPITGGYKVYKKISKRNSFIMNEFKEFNVAKEYILHLLKK